MAFFGLGIKRPFSFFIWKIFSPFFDILPVLGTGGILLPWTVILLVMKNYPMGIGMFVLYIIITIIRNTLEPKIVGKQIGLHPLATMHSTVARLLRRRISLRLLRRLAHTPSVAVLRLLTWACLLRWHRFLTICSKTAYRLKRSSFLKRCKPLVRMYLAVAKSWRILICLPFKRLEQMLAWRIWKQRKKLLFKPL